MKLKAKIKMRHALFEADTEAKDKTVKVKTPKIARKHLEPRLSSNITDSCVNWLLQCHLL